MRGLSQKRGRTSNGETPSPAPDRLYVAREASPLIVGVGVGENVFASDVTAPVRPFPELFA